MLTRYALVTGAIALSGGFVWLGLWQLDRAAEKHALFREFDLRSRMTVPFDQIEGNLASERFKRTRLTGRLDAEHQFLIDNVIVDSRPGYYVLTPLQRQRGQAAVLVNRGWVPAAALREALPDVDVDERLRVVEGQIDRLPRRGVRLGPDAGEGWPRVIQDPETERLAAALGYPLADFQLLLSPEAADGYRREWRPAVSGPERHFGYAVQWFALAATVAIVCAVLIVRRGRDER